MIPGCEALTAKLRKTVLSLLLRDRRSEPKHSNPSEHVWLLPGTELPNYKHWLKPIRNFDDRGVVRKKNKKSKRRGQEEGSDEE